jgi:hypothetical protein
MITQAAAALRRLRELLAGGAQPAEIARQAAAAQGELLGPDGDLLRALDAGSAAALLGDQRRLALWVELLQVEAAAWRQADRADLADSLEARAGALAAHLAGVP